MRQDTKNVLIPTLAIALVLTVATRVNASVEHAQSLEDKYLVHEADTAYWAALKDHYAEQQEAFKEHEKERLALLVDEAQAASEEQARQIAAQRAAAVAAAQRAQATTTQTKTVIQKKVVQKASRTSKAS